MSQVSQHPKPEEKPHGGFWGKAHVANVASVATPPAINPKTPAPAEIAPSAPIETLLAQCRERVAVLEGSGLSRGKARWQAALETLVTPEERADGFTEAGDLKPNALQFVVAIGGIVLTFHRSGELSWMRDQSRKANEHDE